MSNNYPNSEVIEKLRRQYPKGTVVVLDHMNDVQAPEINTAGEVLSVDDIGTVHVSWLSGGTLGVAFGEDAIHKADTHEMALYKIGKESIKQQQNPDGLHFCPRCGEEMDGIRRHALSRNADIVICDACGRAEAVEALIRSGYAGGYDSPYRRMGCC